MAGIANRRRIWEVCTQLSPHYFEKLKLPEKPYEEPSMDEAAAIMRTAHAYDIPITRWPHPVEDDASIPWTSVQFVRSWTELSDSSCELRTYWTRIWHHPCDLRGISLSFGGVERLFGKRTIYRKSTIILARDWISGIVLIMHGIRPELNKQGLKLQRPDPATMTDFRVHRLRVSCFKHHRSTSVTRMFRLTDVSCIQYETLGKYIRTMVMAQSEPSWHCLA